MQHFRELGHSMVLNPACVTPERAAEPCEALCDGFKLRLMVTKSARACSYYSVSTPCNSKFKLLAVQIWLYQCI